MSLETVFVKEEPEWEESEAAAADVLAVEVKLEPNTDHEVKLELNEDPEVKVKLELGPELIQPQDIAFPIQDPLKHEDPEDVNQEPAQVNASPPMPADGTRAPVKRPPSNDALRRSNLKSCCVRIQCINIDSMPRKDSHKTVHQPSLLSHSQAKKEKHSKEKEKLNKILLDIDSTQSGFSCHYCKKEFQRKISLVHHIKMHLPKIPFTGETVSCEVCNKQFNHKCAKGALKTHMRIHTGEKPYTCKVCKKNYRYSRTLTQHMRTHTKGRSSLQGRGESHSLLPARTGLQTPIAHISSIDMDQAQEGVTTLINPPLDPPLPYACHICNEIFTNKLYLKRHIRQHSKPKVTANEKPYLCAACDKRFAKPHLLRAHEKYHVEHRPYYCQACNIGYIDARVFLSHLRRYHKMKPFQCGTCPKWFTHEASLREHEAIHTVEKSHACVVCLRQFSEKSRLDTHMRIHKPIG